MFEKLKLTRKTGRIDVWHDVFTELRGYWIEVKLKDGTKILGWPDFYSENPDKRELFLRNVLITNPDNSSYDIRGDGILLTDKADIESIEFIQ